jgi:hypothetical protein
MRITSDLATTMYYSGLDPIVGQEVYTITEPGPSPQPVPAKSGGYRPNRRSAKRRPRTD